MCTLVSSTQQRNGATSLSTALQDVLNSLSAAVHPAPLHLHLQQQPQHVYAGQ
jgi:hypothetical protein